jgi:hypothetical protein
MSGTESDRKTLDLPEGLDLKEVRLSQIETYYGHYVFMAEDGRKWATHKSLIPETLADSPVVHSCMVDKTAFFITDSGLLFTTKNYYTLH